MKILMINKFHYLRGGSETYYFGLGDALKALGHEVIYFSMQDEKNEPCAQSEYFAPHVGFEAGQSKRDKLRNALGFIYSPAARRSLARLLDREKPDVAHMNLLHRHLTFSVVDELKKRRIPMVFTMHDVIALCPCYTMLSHGRLCQKCADGNPFHCAQEKCVRNSSLMSLLSALEAEYLRLSKGYDKVDLYVAPSQFLQSMLCKSGFSKNPVVFRRNFLPIGTEYRLRYAPDGYLLYFGRLSTEKGIHTLLEARALMEGDTPLCVAGDGPEREWAEGFVRKAGLESRIRLLGYQDKAHMKELLAGARAVIVPSEWYENCPYAVVEAMAMGKPVISTSLGGTKELVRDGLTGALIEPFDPPALARTMAAFVKMDEAKYKAMCEAALKIADESFHVESYARDMVKLYEKLVAGETITSQD